MVYLTMLQQLRTYSVKIFMPKSISKLKLFQIRVADLNEAYWIIYTM
jgi:hypothetical protein